VTVGDTGMDGSQELQKAREVADSGVMMDKVVGEQRSKCGYVSCIPRINHAANDVFIDVLILVSGHGRYSFSTYCLVIGVGEHP
jgi:hypothetical protein